MWTITVISFTIIILLVCSAASFLLFLLKPVDEQQRTMGAYDVRTYDARYDGKEANTLYITKIIEKDLANNDMKAIRAFVFVDIPDPNEVDTEYESCIDYGIAIGVSKSNTVSHQVSYVLETEDISDIALGDDESKEKRRNIIAKASLMLSKIADNRSDLQVLPPVISDEVEKWIYAQDEETIRE